jgi:hypothetical protein
MLLIYYWGIFMKIMHYGFKTRYSIVKDEKIFSFMSLSPRHIYEDQLKMKKKGEAKSSEQLCEDVRKSENNRNIERKY